MSEAKQDEKVGALWTKTSARGEFMTGMIELSAAHIEALQANGGKLPVVVFRNDNKAEGSKQPDWRMLRSKPKVDAPPASRWPTQITADDVPF